jgi:hypothetical protein
MTEMNKQIGILAVGCLAVSLIVAANIVPRVFAQDEFEKKIQSMPATNATGNEKSSLWIISCNVPNIPQGQKLEDHCDFKRLIP